MEKAAATPVVLPATAALVNPSPPITPTASDAPISAATAAATDNISEAANTASECVARSTGSADVMNAPTIREAAATVGEGSNTSAAPASTSSSTNNKAASPTVTTSSSKSPTTGTNNVVKASARTMNVT